MKYYFLSIVVHVVLLSFFIGHIATLHAPKPHPKLSIYLAQDHKIIKKQAHIIKATVSKRNARRSKKHFKMSNELLTIIHNALAANQIYPQDAQMLQQQGTVRIGFYAEPNGALSNFVLEQSSGFKSLDEAALAAAKAASPITELHSYLQTKEYFTIDVIFTV